MALSMATFAYVAIPLPLNLLSLKALKHRKPIKAGVLCSLRLGDNTSPENHQKSDNGPEVNHNDVWLHFKEAQKNILYLNKQRLMAVEELNKVKKEKEALICKIEELESQRKVDVGGDWEMNAGKDKLARWWELLFRIDSMILMGMIGAGDAPEFRSLVMDRKVGIAEALPSLLQKKDTELLRELRRFSEQSKKNFYHIVHICTEMEPVISVGSLASFVTGLSRALLRKGNLVEVILPKYNSLDLSSVQGLQEIQTKFYSYFNGQMHANKIWNGSVHGIGVTFIHPVNYSSFFDREMVYGYPDDLERFSYFSRASLDYLIKLGKHPDVLHIHNWQTAIVGPLFWDIFANQGLGTTRVLLTCHDLSSQCLEKPDKLALCGLDPSRLHRTDRLQDNRMNHLVNILKGGVVYSNKVVVLSSMQSKGRILRNLGDGLEPTLAAHKDKLLTAPYGFENSTWDPLKDKHLPENYTATDMRGKAVCKAALQKQIGLSKRASSVVVGCVCSEASGADMENLMGLIHIASAKGTQFVFMGVGKSPSINRALKSFQEELKDENVKFINKYDEALLHLILGGSDIILCQSYDDPVLQVPLKALRYGAAPITITSGKSHRQIEDHYPGRTRVSQFINSTFANMSLMQAFEEIENMPLEWEKKITDVMTKDFSWDGECCDLHLSAYESMKKC